MLGTNGARAEDDKHWYFDVENESNGTVLEFRTREDDEWSENWLEKRMEPGDTIKLDFETDEGDCEVRTQIHLADGSYSMRPSITARPRRSSSRTRRCTGSEETKNGLPAMAAHCAFAIAVDPGGAGSTSSFDRPLNH